MTAPDFEARALALAVAVCLPDCDCSSCAEDLAAIVAALRAAYEAGAADMRERCAEHVTLYRLSDQIRALPLEAP